MIHISYPRCSRNAHIDPVHPDELHIVQQSGIWRDPSSWHALRPVSKQGGHANESALPNAHAREQKIPTRGKLSLRLLSENEKYGLVSGSTDDFLPVDLLCVFFVFL